MHSEILPIFYTDISQKSTKMKVIRGQGSVWHRLMVEGLVRIATLLKTEIHTIPNFWRM